MNIAKRNDGRQPHDMRPIIITPNASRFAEGSCLVEFGLTRVLVTASVEEQLPPFLRGGKKGWVTAEYAMLPRATQNRLDRERQLRDGRVKEIQRMIGRCLRSATDLVALGERQVKIDCDVISADGGTRTAALSGAWVALHVACSGLVKQGLIAANPLKYQLAAVSVALVNGRPLLDVDYSEDSNASLDGNFVIASDGKLLELQLSAEQSPFVDDDMLAMLALARQGVAVIFAAQNKAIGVAK
ncbi:MAG: ribonuclease PH [Hydrotalea sp.]|nr:ribonuclease PH [Hydrotalea sp.]